MQRPTKRAAQRAKRDCAAESDRETQHALRPAQEHPVSPSSRFPHPSQPGPEEPVDSAQAPSPPCQCNWRGQGTNANEPPLHRLAEASKAWAADEATKGCSLPSCCEVTLAPGTQPKGQEDNCGCSPLAGSSCPPVPSGPRSLSALLWEWCASPSALASSGGYPQRL